MKRFLLICVALIGFMATNASGTYHQTDQLQTFGVQQHDCQIQATAIVPTLTTQVVQVQTDSMPFEKPIVQKIAFVDVYRNPDYGLCSYSKIGLNKYNTLSQNDYGKPIRYKISGYLNDDFVKNDV